MGANEAVCASNRIVIVSTIPGCYNAPMSVDCSCLFFFFRTAILAFYVFFRKGLKQIRWGRVTEGATLERKYSLLLPAKTAGKKER